jgi:hypothetical protein
MTAAMFSFASRSAAFACRLARELLFYDSKACSAVRDQQISVGIL